MGEKRRKCCWCESQAGHLGQLRNHNQSRAFVQVFQEEPSRSEEQLFMVMV